MAWYVHGVHFVHVYIKCIALPSVLVVGTKNVAKQLKKITQGPKKETNVSWFPELADKRTTRHNNVNFHVY